MDDLAALKLLRRIAEVSNEASCFSDAIASGIDEVCLHTGWPVGHAFLRKCPDEDELVSADIWHIEDRARFETFRMVTETTPLQRGIGLPGRVLATGKPAWMVDALTDDNFPRARRGVEIVVRGGFAFPVLVEKRIVAVLEFFSDRPELPDQRLLDLVAPVGTQLGRVAEREAASAVMLAEVEHSRLLIESAYDAFVSIDEDGRVIGWNTAAEQTFGWAQDEAIGRSLAEMIIPHKHRDAHQAGIRRFMETGEGPILNTRLELTALRRDGEEFPVELAVWALESGKQQTFCAFVRDVSFRKESEKALQEAYEREKQMVAKLNDLDEAKTAFVSSVSHELRTPLTSIIGYLDLVDGSKGVGGDDREMLDIVRRNSSRLLSLIDDLLTVSRLEAGTFQMAVEPTLVAPIVRSVMQSVHPSAVAKSLHTHVEVDGDVGFVLGDGAQLERMLLNLISNAVKFTPVGGTVKIEAVRESDQVRVVVSDTGRGIPKSDIPKLFGRFFRSPDADRSAEPGTGLGLAIVKGIVDQHHGSISVDSNTSRGTKVTVRLPAATPVNSVA